ncbi:hypothetical protein KHU50_003723 [Colletotrichum sp. SAR 10_65]|nr:hypothetical protein KHU50_003723 [Colletotrichum sp. SAR 10_65]
MRDAVNSNELEYGVASIDRLWLNNVTSTTLTFTYVDENGVITVKDRKLHFKAGTYIFNASFNYPQLTQLPPENTLAESANGLVEEEHYIVQGLAFLSSSGRFLAGAWRFLTYFGRGSVISVLLVESILSHEWRGSAYGFGGGRISYDANAIVPDGQRAGAALAEAGFFPGHLDCAKKRRALPRRVKTRH